MIDGHQYNLGKGTWSQSQGESIRDTVAVAVYQGNLAEVRRLLDAGLSADATVAGRTDCPLWVASLRGHGTLDIVKV